MKLLIQMYILLSITSNVFCQLRYFSTEHPPFIAVGYGLGSTDGKVLKNRWLSLGVKKVEFSCDITTSNKGDNNSVITTSIEYIPVGKNLNDLRLSIAIGKSFDDNDNPMLLMFAMSKNITLFPLFNSYGGVSIIPEVGAGVVQNGTGYSGIASFGSSIMIRFRSRMSIFIRPQVGINEQRTKLVQASIGLTAG